MLFQETMDCRRRRVARAGRGRFILAAGGVFAYALVMAWATAGAAAAETSHGAHEHGTAAVDLVVEGSDVLVNFASPLYNLVGFEHAPRDDEDRDAIAVARALLEDPANLVLLRAEAACAVVELDVHWEVASAEEEAHDHDEAGEHGAHDDDDHGDDAHDAEDAHEEEHADVTVAIRYRCDHPDRLDALDITGFESFERLSEVELRAVGPGGAVAQSPERESPRVDLRGLFER